MTALEKLALETASDRLSRFGVGLMSQSWISKLDLDDAAKDKIRKGYDTMARELYAPLGEATQFIDAILKK